MVQVADSVPSCRQAQRGWLPRRKFFRAVLHFSQRPTNIPLGPPQHRRPHQPHPLPAAPRIDLQLPTRLTAHGEEIPSTTQDRPEAGLRRGHLQRPQEPHGQTAGPRQRQRRRPERPVPSPDRLRGSPRPGAARSPHARPATLHRRHPAPQPDLRHRSGGYRQELLRRRARGAGARGGADRSHHPHAPRRRGWRAARFSARRSRREVRALHRCLPRHPERALGRRYCRVLPATRPHPGVSTRLHAWQDLRRAQFRGARRGTEHHAGADEVIPHPDRGGRPGRGER